MNTFVCVIIAPARVISPHTPPQRKVKLNVIENLRGKRLDSQLTFMFVLLKKKMHWRKVIRKKKGRWCGDGCSLHVWLCLTQCEFVREIATVFVYISLFLSLSLCVFFLADQTCVFHLIDSRCCPRPQLQKYSFIIQLLCFLHNAFFQSLDPPAFISTFFSFSFLLRYSVLNLGSTSHSFSLVAIHSHRQGKCLCFSASNFSQRLLNKVTYFKPKYLTSIVSHFNMFSPAFV